MLANYLRSVCKKRTAVLEWNDHGDFARFGKICVRQKTDRACWRIQGVDFYSQADTGRLAECLAAGYQEILIDFGVAEKTIYEELLRCSMVLMVVSFSEWQMDAFWDSAEPEKFAEKESWKFLAAFGSEESRREWNRRRKPKVLRIPLSVDAFTITGELIEWMRNIL